MDGQLEVPSKLPPLSITEINDAIVAADRQGSTISLVSTSSGEEGIVDCFSGEDAQPTINIINSSDVVVGSVTQFHGPVTIIQQVSGSESDQNSMKSDDFKKANLVTKEDIEATKTSVEVSCLPRRLLFCFSVVAFTLVVIVLALIFTITPNDNGEEKDSSPGDYTEEYNISGHEYYTRAEWGGREPKWVDEIEGQVNYVIVSHTVTDQCKTFQECANIMRLMQDIHVNDGSPNIGYNFVIGGDANVYEGRGWFAQNFHKFDRNSLGISFTGNYVYDELDSNMMDVFMLLLELGVELKVLSPNYRIVAHNQTLNTISPGVNIYKEIKYMPNFYEYMQPRIEMDDDQ